MFVHLVCYRITLNFLRSRKFEIKKNEQTIIEKCNSKQLNQRINYVCF